MQYKLIVIIVVSIILATIVFKAGIQDKKR
jgi:hypothetical protein